MEHPQNPNRAEAERLLGIAEKLLQTRDLSGSREFAMLAQETEPLLEGSDQILAITDVLIASDRRVNNNRHHDWYAILQTEKRSDLDLVKKNYRRLALLLHPDKNKYPLADTAFKLVADAWAVLSDPTKRTPYDHELSLFSKVDLRHQPVPEYQHRGQNEQTQQGQNQNQQQQSLDKDKLPVRRSPRAGGAGGGGGGGGGGMNTMPPPSRNRGQQQPRVASFWTACPYCYVLYEYPRSYEECCLRCQNCERAFHAAAIPSLPPMVPGKEAYYCCWGFFPLGFSLSKVKEANGGNAHHNNHHNDDDNVNINVNNGGGAAAAGAVAAGGGGNSNNPNSGFPNWMPGMFTPPVAAAAPQQAQGLNVNMSMNMNNMPAGGFDMSDGSGSAGFGNNVSGGYRDAPPGMPVPGAKKRGRPRKNPFPV